MATGGCLVMPVSGGACRDFKDWLTRNSFSDEGNALLLEVERISADLGVRAQEQFQKNQNAMAHRVTTASLSL